MTQKDDDLVKEISKEGALTEIEDNLNKAFENSKFLEIFQKTLPSEDFQISLTNKSTGTQLARCYWDHLLKKVVC